MIGTCARCKKKTDWDMVDLDTAPKLKCSDCGLKAYYPHPWPLFGMMHGESIGHYLSKKDAEK